MATPNTELVVLVDDRDQILGTVPKATVHGATTPLHRGFSLFVFNPRGQLLLQQRAHHKLTWPGVWSNTCCGHPAPAETYEQAASRRVHEELGLQLSELLMVAPYRYRFSRNGIEENEICPILVAWTDEEPLHNPEEVAATRWVDWGKFCAEVRATPGRYSEWCEEQIEVLERTPAFAAWYQATVGGKRLALGAGDDGAVAARGEGKP